MSTSQGLGRRRPGHLAFQPWSAQFGIGPAGEAAGRTMANELYHGGYPPLPVQIPMGWLRGPVRLRMDPPVARAEVSQTAGTTARSRNSAAVINGREWVVTETLNSIVPTDAANLAKWVTDYYDIQMPRSAALTLTLNSRTPTEIWRILGVTQGTHISITGTTGWPDGSTELVVEGITHRITGDVREVTWNTAPIIGATPGVAGPWFYTDDSRTSSTAVVPF